MIILNGAWRHISNASWHSRLERRHNKVWTPPTFDRLQSDRHQHHHHHEHHYHQQPCHNHHLYRNFTSSDRRFGFYNEEVFTKDLIVMHYLSTCSCFFTIRYDYVYNWMVHCTMYIQPLDPHIHILLKLAPFILSDAVVYFNGQETCFAIFVQDGKHVYTWRPLCNGLLQPFQTNGSDLFDGLKRLKTPHQHSFPFQRSS